MGRTLKQYISDINTQLRNFIPMHNAPPDTFITTMINDYRRFVAEETKCLECWNTCDSESGVAIYQKPEDCIRIIDVWYVATGETNGDMLIRKNEREMNMLRDEAYNANGRPVYWAEYGGRNQPSGYIYVYPTPDTSFETIKIHTRQLPQPLTLPDDECELPFGMQRLVIDGIVIELRDSLNKPDPRYPYRNSVWLRKVKSAVCPEVL